MERMASRMPGMDSGLRRNDGSTANRTAWERDAPFSIVEEV